MEWLEIATLSEQFGADVFALGALVFALTLLLKKRLLKRAPKKYVTFVPFVLGVALYAVFALLVNFSALRQAQEIVQKGLSAGGAATVIHVVYEQFIRGGSATSAALKEQCALELLQGFSEEIPEGLAKLLAEIPAGEGAAERFKEALKEKLPALTETERVCLAKALEQTLKYV